ncbi:protein DpdD [Thermobifida halotolerans]|nr:protein DpdD [Thermobifida halotolerans]
MDGITRAWNQSDIDPFLKDFFGEGNDARRYGSVIELYINALRGGKDAPAVLPRFIASDNQFMMYVIARDAAEVSWLRDLLEAFAGPTYCTDGWTAPARLDPHDPVDAAVIDFAGPDRTFVLKGGPNREYRTVLRQMLKLMQDTIASSPRRELRLSRPLGRLLAEFNAALAAGGEAASLEVLEQLAARGGLGATNLAHLRIKRLDRLGLSEELLALPGLNSVLRQNPPLPVKEAVLNAVHSAIVAEPLSRDGLVATRDALFNTNLPSPLPWHEDVGPYGDEAVTVLVTAAIARDDIPTVRRMRARLAETGRLGVLPEPLREALGLLADADDRQAEDESRSTATGTVHSSESGIAGNETAEQANAASATAQPPTSWPELMAAMSGDETRYATVVRNAGWRKWPSPAESDRELSAVADALDYLGWERAWQHLTAPFIDAVGYEQPAPSTALSFLTYAVSFDRFGPGDLVTVQALLEIYLRSAPPADAYREVLDALRGSCEQWVSPNNAVEVLDFADRLVLAACPDPEARTRLAVALLEPLHRHRGRLKPSDLFSARKLSKELELGFDWTLPEQISSEEENPLPDRSLTASVLLYSLDPDVLQRTAKHLGEQFPEVRVALAQDKVGGDSLRQKARNADVIVLAVRCATHAATGFINQHSNGAVLRHANGSGSVSLLRATVEGLAEWNTAVGGKRRRRR